MITDNGKNKDPFVSSAWHNELLDDVVWIDEAATVSPEQVARLANMAAEAQPLTFRVSRNGFAWLPRATLEAAARAKRDHKADIVPLREPVGADFASYSDRILLAELGYFSCDLPEAKAKRDHAAQIEAYIDEAYDVMNLDRKQQHAAVAALLEATRFDGIWARSTGEYAAACRRLDDAMLEASPAIAVSVDELRNASRAGGVGQ